jgi:hypothetical protein
MEVSEYSDLACYKHVPTKYQLSYIHMYETNLVLIMKFIIIIGFF